MLPRLLIATALFSVAATPALAAPRGLTIDDLVSLERVASPVLSPDGTRVLYTVRTTDLDKNKGHTEIWMLDLRTPKALPVQLTNSEGNNTEPSWSAAGDAVYFLSTRSKSSQVWRVAANGGEPVKVTDLPLDVDTYRVSPTGDRLALTMEVFRDCPTLACTVQRSEEKSKAKSGARTYDSLFVRHWDTWAVAGQRAVLHSIALGSDGRATGEVSNLSGALDGDVPSKPDGDKSDYAFSPDGASIVFSVRVAGKGEPWSTNFDLYQVSAKGGSAPRNLTADNLAWDAEPVFSPDGKTLAYRAMRRPGFEADRFQLMLLDVATGKKTKVADKWDRSIENLQWSQDGKAIYGTAQDVGQLRLYKVALANGTVDALTTKGSVSGYSVRNDKVVATIHDLNGPSQLYALGGSAQLALTTNNAARMTDIRLGQFEQFSFKGAKGDTVYGHVMKPWNAEPGKRYPVAFLVHGGPQGSFGNSWSYRWNPQVYAGAGYAVVFIDFHGSTGYGQNFTDAIRGDWGGKPLEDLKKGLAAAGAKYPWLDEKRACALGASYGGYMMNWIAGNWNDGFKCLVNHSGIFDNRAMYYETEELWFPEWEHGGTYYKAAAAHEKHNPVNHVTKWKTPMLVLHGERDYRIAYSQSLATFTALQRQGIDSKLVVFPDENHHILKPANSLLWHRTVLEWLHLHLK
jgi:dipeptidyl aminopeptidase/acylaminoacyl peptidase